jgi:hypothetical protein
MALALRACPNHHVYTARIHFYWRVVSRVPFQLEISKVSPAARSTMTLAPMAEFYAWLERSQAALSAR